MHALTRNPQCKIPSWHWTKPGTIDTHPAGPCVSVPGLVPVMIMNRLIMLE